MMRSMVFQDRAARPPILRLLSPRCTVYAVPGAVGSACSRHGRLCESDLFRVCKDVQRSGGKARLDGEIQG